MIDTSFEALALATETLRKYQRARVILLIVSIVVLGLSIFLFFVSGIIFIPDVAARAVEISRIIMLLTGGFLFVILFSYTSYKLKGRAGEFYQEKIAKAEERAEAEPEKVKPAWDLARVTLEAYFNRNLGQVTNIFWLSVAVMLVGFGVIVWGISQSLQSSNTVAPAAITVVAGVITEFIGATFLFIYRSTVQQAINYTKTLERINSVGMAMQILDTMPDETKEGDLKSRTKAMLVELLVKQVSEASKDSNSNPG